MSKSLQDQLLKAGLANKKQAVKAKKAINNREKLKRAGKEVDNDVARAAEQARQEKLTKDRELNELKNREAEQVAVQAQIDQLVDMNTISERGDIDFSFPEGKLIKTISVTDRQRGALTAGVLAVVKRHDKYHLVPRKTAEKIAERDENAVLLCNIETGDQQYEDEYADYQVPDDLMW